MRFSLQSREIIADSIETVTCAQFHDACIAIPGCDRSLFLMHLATILILLRCDKNMPGVVMAMARHNRPSMMIYGGSSGK